MDFICLPIIFFTGLLLISILTSVFSVRAGIPLILLFIIIGTVVGSQQNTLLFISFLTPRTVFFIGSVALALILFDSGFNTPFSTFKSYAKPAVFLASVGVLLAALLLTPVILYLLPVTFLEGFLLASIIGSTDAAAVFFLLRSHQLSLKPKIQSTLEIESGSNDPMAIFLTFFCITLIRQKSFDSTNIFHLAAPFATQLTLGIIGGLILYYLVKKAFEKIPLQTPLYPLFVIAAVLLGFSVITLIGGSGYLAVYICGVLLGDIALKFRSNLTRFLQTSAWLCQILMFTVLGLFVQYQELPLVLGKALIIAATLTLFARPLMVFILLSFFKKYSFLEKVFIAFVGLRGATSILLALAPLVAGLNNGLSFFNIVFIMVLFSLSVQGFFIPLCARLCSVIQQTTSTRQDREEIDIPELSRSSLLIYHLKKNAAVLHGQLLPKWAQPLLLKRGDIVYQPNNMPSLQAGDKVYVFAPSHNRILLLDSLYGNPFKNDKLKIWGDIAIAPSTTLKELHNLYGTLINGALPSVRLDYFIQQTFPEADIGDRISIGGIELVIRSKSGNAITAIGIDVAPNPKTKALLLHSAKEKLKL